MTQRELGTLCGTNEFQISRYENGKIDPSSTFLELMARHLNISADYLIGLVDYPDEKYGEALTPEQIKLLHAYESGDMATVLEMVSARMRQAKKD